MSLTEGVETGGIYRLIVGKGISYTGYDIVKHVIEANKNLYEAPSIQFINEDFSGADLPSADFFVLCKDVLQHLPNDVIIKLIPQLKKFKYCLLINDVSFQSENDQNTHVVGGPVVWTSPNRRLT